MKRVMSDEINKLIGKLLEDETKKIFDEADMSDPIACKRTEGWVANGYYVTQFLHDSGKITTVMANLCPVIISAEKCQ